jgi:hypothetical protein
MAKLSVVEEILAVSGSPVAGSTLDKETIQTAIKEGRVLYAGSWSTMGDREAKFQFVTTFHPTEIDGYLVFPSFIPSRFHHYSWYDSNNQGLNAWEEVNDVFTAFGIPSHS